MTIAPTRPSKFTGLEVGRGIAALLVVMHHAGNNIAEPRFYDTLLWGGALRNFNVGVDFFFVLSGFIIAWVHWPDLGRPDRLGHYAIRRFLRIYPPYWGVVLPLAALYFAFPGAGKPYQRDLVNLVMSIGLLPYPEQPILGVAWTLVHEVIFYLVFGILIAFGRPAAWLLVAWAAAIGIAQAFAPLPFPLSILFNAFNLEFLMGVGLAVWLRGRRVPVPGLFALTGCGAFLAFLLFAPAIQDIALVGRLAFGLSSAVAVAGIVEWERSRGLRVPAALLGLGAASYAIYLVHGVALSAAIHVITKVGPRPIALELVLVLMVAAGVAAGTAYHLAVEKPLARAFRAPALPRRPAGPPPSAEP